MSKLNKNISNILLILFILISLKCNDQEKVEPVSINISDEIKEGAWLFQKVEDEEGNILLNGIGQPEMVLFFQKDSIVKGRLVGKYTVDQDSIHIIASIFSLTPIYNAEFEKLGNFPKRYYDFENYLKNGLSGKIRYYENGWDSQISIHMPDDRVIWMIRY
jgi:hypothetical protein